MNDAIGIVGLGYALPDSVRTNDDPLFGGERSAVGRDLFAGFRERRVLAPGERIEDLAVRAAANALADAGVTPESIDRLYGTISPSEPILPNGLFAVHAGLGLARETAVVPIQSDFTNALVGLVAACEAIAAGRIARALVVVGGAWSRLVDYADAGAVGIGDAAGAFVVGRGARFAFVDDVTETRSDLRHAMTVEVRTAKRSPAGTPAGPRPVFVFEEAGAQAFRELALSVPEKLVTRLLSRHGLAAADVALVAHQASGALLDAWQARLGVGELPRTLDSSGNATVATIASTLARTEKSLRSQHVVLLGMGVGQNFTAVLLRRT